LRRVCARQAASITAPVSDIPIRRWSVATQTGSVQAAWLAGTDQHRVGRNAIDVQSTVERLAAEGIRVHRLAAGSVDLTSTGGKMAMVVPTAVAEFERDLLIE
jgi:DNA invertase Pin-like site-specific DNA recombinase